MSAYSYDSDSHVTGMTWTMEGNQLGNLTYAYDADGRVISKGGSFAQINLPAAASGNTFNADNAMTAFNGTSLKYDANGNLTSDGTYTYTWDARNHLTQISQKRTTVATFQYDAFGRRVEKTVNGVTTQYLYDGLNPVEELDGSSPANVTETMLTGLGIDQYFARTDSNGTMSYLTNRLGSTIALANSSGALSTQYSYEPFRATTVSGSSTNPFQFTGRENDGTGLYYYRARYYSPTFGRFISQDPLGFGGGDPNLYAYVADAPEVWIDPLGLLTGQLGAAINLQIGPFSLSLNVGVAADTAGNFGFYYQPGFAYGTGEGFGGTAGVNVGTSNGKTICDLAGPFANGTAFAGDGLAGADNVFAGKSPDGQVLGSDLTLGAGGGAGASVGVTTTTVVPLFHF